MQGYTINEKGEPILEFRFKETSRGLVVNQVIDRRQAPLESWQVNHAGDVKGLNFLQKIENKDQILLWSQKGRLKRVELPRLG